MINNIPCIILSGGKSSRMGENKSLLSFGGFSTLIEYQYSRLCSIFSDVYISSKQSFAFTQNIIFDTVQDVSSPMAALNSIFEYLPCDRVFIITVDTPFVSQETILNIIQNSNESDISIAKTSGNKTHNLCGVFNKSLYPKIKHYVDNDIHRIGLLIKEHKTNIIDCDSEKEFLNLNTKEDYAQALKLF